MVWVVLEGLLQFPVPDVSKNMFQQIPKNDTEIGSSSHFELKNIFVKPPATLC